MTAMERSHAVKVDGVTVDVLVSDRGEGKTFLLLHGGGGPMTVEAFAELLSTTAPARVIVPTHPGFGGTPRPDALSTVPGLARLYAELLDQLDVSDVVVIGNSIGGWIAAEMALGDTRRIQGVAIVDGVGIVVAGHPIADFFSLRPRELAERSYYDPDRYGIDPAKLPPAALQAMAGNRAAIAVYAGTAMSDPSLAPRLNGVTVPALVVWGDVDRIADVDYGRALAASIPGATFTVLEHTGHMPQIESLQRLREVILDFAQDRRPARRMP